VTYLGGVLGRAAAALGERRPTVRNARGDNDRQRHVPLAPGESPGAKWHVQSMEDALGMLQGQLDQGVAKSLTDADARKSFFRWQYAAATAIGEAVMMVEYSVQVRQGDAWVDDDQHDLARLLRRINPFMTGLEFFLWAVVDCMLVGKSWWHIARNGVEEPSELWPLVGTVKPILKLNDPKVLMGWKQTVSGEHGIRDLTYPADEVVYLRLPKPGDLWGGLGPAQAAGSSIKLDQQIIESEWAAFRYGLFPFAVIYFSEQDPKKRERMLEEFQEKYTGAQETGRAVGDLKALATFYHSSHDLAAPLASGSYVSPHVRAMIVAPCSMKTLAAIASGYAENLIGRAADVTLKEGKRLVLVPRESPLNSIHLENLLRLARLGVAIVPPIPPFYQLPSTVPELLDQIVGRILDQVGLHTDLSRRWSGRR